MTLSTIDEVWYEKNIGVLRPFQDFIPSSESNAYLKQIKVILSAVKKYRIFFTSDEYDLYFFTVANRGCFDNLGLNFFQKRSGMHRTCLASCYGSMHVK